ncbi:MAG: LytTR family DNA-binding domain-containing protein [Ruminococcus sp.]|nr:LytTR family DNA-binding domain-containing protein [Ruminococcus sp.]
MRVLICDDEVFAVDSIKKMVAEYFNERNISAEIIAETDSTKVIDDNVSVDIAFLDVEMPKHSGLEIAKHLLSLNSNTIVFIITSHQGYLDSAMDLRVFRFLPKPPDRQRIFSGLDSAIRFYNENTRMLLTDGSTSQRIYVRDILYITIHKRKTLVVTKSEEIISDRSLGEWKEILPDACFAQPHYSYIVNLQNIEKLEKDNIILKKNNNETVNVKISQRKYKDFKNHFFDYISQENF